MLRCCTSSCTASHIDSAWRLLKQAVPKSLASKKGHAYNPALIKHCRSWQWRWENTGTSLFQKTAKVLNETVQSTWLSLAIEQKRAQKCAKTCIFQENCTKMTLILEAHECRKQCKTQEKNQNTVARRISWTELFAKNHAFRIQCLAMSSIWTPRTDKTWVQFPTRRVV